MEQERIPQIVLMSRLNSIEITEENKLNAVNRKTRRDSTFF